MTFLNTVTHTADTSPASLLPLPVVFRVLFNQFGFEIANIDSLCDGETLAILNDFFECFDVSVCALSGEDQIDYREVVCALRIFTQPLDNVEQQLRWAFVLFSSHGTMNLPDPGRVPKADVMRLLCNFGKDAKAKEEILELTEKARSELPSRMYLEEPMSMAAFDQLLKSPSLKGTVQDYHLLWDDGCYVYGFEDFFCPEALVHMRRDRKALHQKLRLRAFELRWGKRRMYMSLEVWLEVVAKRKYKRALVNHTVKRWRHNMIWFGWQEWKRGAVRHGAMSVIQVRGGATLLEHYTSS